MMLIEKIILLKKTFSSFCQGELKWIGHTVQFTSKSLLLHVAKKCHTPVCFHWFLYLGSVIILLKHHCCTEFVSFFRLACPSSFFSIKDMFVMTGSLVWFYWMAWYRLEFHCVKSVEEDHFYHYIFCSTQQLSQTHRIICKYLALHQGP